jgi:hypothetical protein
VWGSGEMKCDNNFKLITKYEPEWRRKWKVCYVMPIIGELVLNIQKNE